MNRANELPIPSDDEQAHSERLQALIRDEIAAANGLITFARFMELALYAPGLGYYAAGARKFGEAGDFVTAPELSPLFSQCLAQQCQQLLRHLGGGAILEFGAGTGTMASDILLELERLGTLPDHYLILELSADLQQRQQETLRRRVPHLFARIEWLSALPAPGFKGVILANEVVDAMPVHLIRFEEQGAREGFVSWQEGRFVWCDRPLSTPELQQQIATLQLELDAENFCRGYTSEINLVQRGWIRSLAGLLEQGVALIIDYGFPRHEYYHPERTGGTLMCHYRHRAHADPLILVGLQDITAHVDFTALAEAALDCGLEVLGYTGQAQFLLANGLGERIAAIDQSDARRYLEITQQVKKLTLPNEMGELFKVLALGRNYDGVLNGFMLQDRRHTL
jgi:SAM-dependent MidA family methyltransferase